jgi:L-fuculose-phosphate aldolase
VATPTGRSKGFLEAADLVVVDLEGHKLSGRLEPTSELPMHLFAYRSRRDVGAVVHAHPPRATGFAVAGVPLAGCVLPEVILTLGSVPLAPYATPSTGEVPASIGSLIGDYNAILLMNHGVLTLGRDIEQAYFRMETVEHFAEITLSARALGGPSPLSREEVRKLLKVRETLDAGGSGACVACGACDGSGEHEAAAGGASGAAPREAASGEEDDIVRAVLAELGKVLDRGGSPGRTGGE